MIPDAPQPAIEAHAMNPESVLRMARAMNIEVKNVLLVGCEPETLGGEEGQMGLSASVRKLQWIECGRNWWRIVIEQDDSEHRGDR